MFCKRKLSPGTVGFLLLHAVLVFIVCLPASADNTPFTHLNKNAGDTTGPVPGQLLFPIHDSRGDFLQDGPRSTYDFKKPANITDSIAYDFATQRYYVYEKIGNKYYRTPTYYTSEEYWQLRGRQQEVEYFRKRANTLNLLNRKLVKPKLSMYDNLFNRLFGNGKIEISPQGNVDIMAGYQGQDTKNPTLPERARKNGGFDFNMNAQVNVNANIGDKLKFPLTITHSLILGRKTS
jgi:hypothetical protein